MGLRLSSRMPKYDHNYTLVISDNSKTKGGRRWVVGWVCLHRMLLQCQFTALTVDQWLVLLAQQLSCCCKEWETESKHIPITCLSPTQNREVSCTESVAKFFHADSYFSEEAFKPQVSESVKELSCEQCVHVFETCTFVVD